MVKTALDSMTNTQSITIKVNPENFQTINQEQEFWLPIHKDLKDINIEQDSRIEKCSCIIESDTTSIEMKLSEIVEKFDDAIKSVFEKKVQQNKIEKDVSPPPQEGENEK